MKRRDFIILAIVLVASAALLLFRPQAAQDSNTSAYLRVFAPDRPVELIELNEEREFRIELDNGDYNVVEIFPGGFRVIEANCPHQDCIRQGAVTTENIGGRVLANEVICLPHKLVLSLVTAEEAARELTP